MQITTNPATPNTFEMTSNAGVAGRISRNRHDTFTVELATGSDAMPSTTNYTAVLTISPDGTETALSNNPAATGNARALFAEFGTSKALLRQGRRTFGGNPTTDSALDRIGVAGLSASVATKTATWNNHTAQ